MINYNPYLAHVEPYLYKPCFAQFSMRERGSCFFDYWENSKLSEPKLKYKTSPVSFKLQKTFNFCQFGRLPSKFWHIVSELVHGGNFIEKGQSFRAIAAGDKRVVYWICKSMFRLQLFCKYRLTVTINTSMVDIFWGSLSSEWFFFLKSSSKVFTSSLKYLCRFYLCLLGLWWL
jgi:hypothetical protein